MTIENQTAHALGTQQKTKDTTMKETYLPLDELYSYRQKALDDNDHTSVLTFTSMIAAREADRESL